MTIQAQFADRTVKILQQDTNVIGLAVAGSWLTNEIDAYSDLDLVVVTKEIITDDKAKMLAYAESFGNLLNGFTGEHVGEPRVLICLYDDPLLHVDIKYLTLEEFKIRIETPTILLDTDDLLKNALNGSEAEFPYPDYQWIEDRFWIWIHYALLKIGRGEYFEAIDFFAFIRMVVLGPLLHIKNKNLPRGVRKVETQLDLIDFKQLKLTLASHDKRSTLNALNNIIKLYQDLRAELFDSTITRQKRTEDAVLLYFKNIDNR